MSVSNVASNVCEPADDCCAAPAEFVRLRYFFGQRLGVLELSDEQSYVVGKQRFHNLRAHGAGVLCGLRADRLVTPQGAPPSTPTTALRVHAGAALDRCGREIVVGWDQCIDIAAWFRANLASNPELQAWLLPNAITPPPIPRLWVLLRYRECPSDPSPAPRDPCGCDAGGCEFGRIREGFELFLATPKQAQQYLVPEALPDGAASFAAEEVLDASLETALDRYYNLVVAGDCPTPPPDSALPLARFTVTVDANAKQVTDIGAPDNSVIQRLTLMPTALMQRELLRALASDASSGLVGAGPALQTLDFNGSAALGGTLSVAVQLAGTAAQPVQLAGVNPVAKLRLAVNRFNDDGSWTNVAATLGYDAGAKAVTVTFADNSLPAAGARFRLVLENDRDTPVVDTRMRPLWPSRFARHFRLVKSATANQLQLSPTLFD